jgi:hypothetical protein
VSNYEIRVQSGRVAEAYQLIEQILAAVIGADVGFYLPQLLRLRQDCLARLPPTGRVDTSGVLAAVTRLAKLHNDRLLALHLAAALGGGSRKSSWSHDDLALGELMSALRNLTFGRRRQPRRTLWPRRANGCETN